MRTKYAASKDNNRPRTAGGLRGLLRPARSGRRYRLAADVTREDDWETVDVPRIRMSRAIAVMLGLHLIAVGGLFAFHLLGSDDEAKPAAATGDTPMIASIPQFPSTAAASELVRGEDGAIQPLEAPPSGAASAAESLASASQPAKYYRILDGDSKIAIAARNGVTPVDLDEANPGATYQSGTDIVIPKKRQVIAPAESTDTRSASTHALEPSGDHTQVVRNTFALNDSRLQEQEPSSAAERPRSIPASASNNNVVSDVPPAREEPKRSAVTTRKEQPAKAVSPQAAEKLKPVVAKKEIKDSKSTPAAGKSASAGGKSVTVARGDTIYSLSRKLGVTASALMAANGITDPARLRVGQVLKAPARS